MADNRNEPIRLDRLSDRFFKYLFATEEHKDLLIARLMYSRRKSRASVRCSRAAVPEGSIMDGKRNSRRKIGRAPSELQ